MKIILILFFILTIGCSAHKKEINEHRWIVSIGKQIIAPGFGFGK